MRTRPIVFAALAAILALTTAGPAQQSAEELYKAGLYQEEVGGDLQKAIGIYQDLLKRFPNSREAAAKAQLHIGLCYEKMGTQEAEKAFQKVVDNYPEQSDAVREARGKLALLFRARAAVKTAAPEFKLRQVWAGRGVDTMGSVTPDGRYLSFVDWETGDLAVRDLVSGTNRRLTDKGAWDQSPEFAMYSVWSRDGRRLAYQWYGKDDFLEIRVHDTLDSSVKTIVRDKSSQDWAQAFDWSPDGTTVLVAFWEAATSSQINRGRVGLVSLKDGSVRMLKGHFETLSAYNFGWGFSISPDGRFIAYGAPSSSERAGDDDIFLISLDEGTEERVVEHPGFDAVVAWMPDGRGLLFRSDRTGSEDLYLLPLSDGRPQESPRLIKSGIGAIAPLGITSSGDLYYGLGGGGTDIYVADIGARAGDAPAPFKRLALPHQGRNMFPDIAPDGDRIAFISTPPGRGQILGVVSQKTGRVRHFQLGLPMYVAPRWIPPDGRSLSVQGRDKDGLSVLVKVDVETGEASPIISLEKGWSFNDRVLWAPDGKRVYYSSGISTEKGRSISVYDLATGRSERLSGCPDEAHFIAISPDGKWLALLNSQGRRSLRVMPAAGGEPREIHGFEHAGGAVINPAWSADGRSIYVPKLRDAGKNVWDLYRVPLDGGNAEKIGLGLARISSLSAGPGGREIAFQSLGSGPQPSEVWVMENFPQVEPPAAAKAGTDIQIRKVWDNAIDSYFLGSASPDGKLMTYVDWDNFANLGVRDLATGEGRLLTDNKSWESGEMCYQSVFSPDGGRIAYAWQTKEGPAQLRIIGTDGSGSRVLSDGKDASSQGLGAWSRDGKQILAYRYRADRTIEIVLVSVDDGKVKPVKTLTGLGAVSIELCLSPDARYVAYSCPRPEDLANVDIFAVSADGSRESTLISHPAEDVALGWDPDGKRLLFKSDRTGGTGVWAIDVREGLPQGEPRLLKTDLGAFSPLSLAKDGRLFYGLHTGWSDIFVAALDPETGKVLSRPVKTVLRNEGRNSAPDWSPDGLTLACRTSGSSAEPGRAALFLQTLRTGETRELILKRTSSLNFHFLRWSPDGRKLLCIGVDEKGSYGALHAVDALTGNSNIFARSDDRGFIFGCEWAPDGKSVYFLRRGKNERALVQLDLETGQETALFKLPNTGYYRFSLSPDGKEAALTTQDKLSVYSLAGGTSRDLVKAKDINAFGWTRDGKYVLYGLLRKGTKNVNDLWRIPSAGGEAQKLDIGMINLMHVRVHPDGQRIVFTAGDRPEKAEVWVMENFLPSEKK